MNDTSSIPVGTRATGLSRRIVAVGLPLLATLAVFVLAARSGSEISDRGLLPIVMFMGGLKLTVAWFVSLASSYRYARMRRRWMVGQIASFSMAAGAGLIWSASAFVAGFLFFLVGLLLVSLLLMKEVEASLRRSYRARSPH